MQKCKSLIDNFQMVSIKACYIRLGGWDWESDKLKKKSMWIFFKLPNIDCTKTDSKFIQIPSLLEENISEFAPENRKLHNRYFVHSLHHKWTFTSNSNCFTSDHFTANFGSWTHFTWWRKWWTHCKRLVRWWNYSQCPITNADTRRMFGGEKYSFVGAVTRR